ncbi:hypothetical protein M8C21_028143, partial [Ambrosia artemisiifolia]
LGLDVVEQILVRSDVVDLIRCKSVCKSWQSIISDPRFVKAHLNHAYTNDRNNPELGHRRVCLSVISGEDSWFYSDCVHIVGSCNGLLCVSPKGVKFVVTNPSTREHKKLPTPPFRPHMHKIGMIREVVCWGFGYDSSTDDYKVIAGFMKDWHSKHTRFHALTLKSNTWKAIGKVKYSTYVGKSEEFKEIPLPDPSLLYDRDCFDYRLGGKYDVAHYLPITLDSQMTSSDGVDDGTRVPVNGEYIRASIFVKSLVSPYSHDNNHCEGQKRNAKELEDTKSDESGAKGNKIRKKKCKRSKRCSKHKKPLV